MSLTKFHTTIKELSLLMTSWPSQLDPLLKDPTNNGILLNGVNNAGISLAANTPLAINHLLQRTQQGWMLTDINSNANVWRTQPFNTTTLTLESDADVSIKLFVF